jgi:hypothetical protein
MAYVYEHDGAHFVPLTANPTRLMDAISDALEQSGDLVGLVRNASLEQVRAQSRYVA